jgi:hypothetical protein
MRVRSFVPAILVAAPALVYIAALILGEGYVLGWQRAASVTWREGLPLALAYAGYVGFVFIAIVGPHADRFPAGVKWIGLICGSVALQIAATAVVEPFPLRGIFFRQFSQFTNGFVTIGSRWDSLASVFANYTDLSQGWPIHPRHQPPGLMLIFWATTQIAGLFPTLAATLAPLFRPLTCFDQGVPPLSDVQVIGGALGATVEFVAATLAIIPLWRLVRRLSTEKAAWLAAAILPMSASMIAWVSRWDRVFVLFTIGGVGLIETLLAAARQGRKDRAALAAVGLGALMALALFFAYKLVPIYLCMGLYALARAVQLQGRADTVALRRWLAIVAAFGLVAAGTAAALWVGFSALTGYDAVSHFRGAMGFHLTVIERPYWPWVIYSSLDVFNHVGLPFVAVALIWGWRKAYPLALAFFGTLLVLSVGRIAHDETGRLLSYVSPLVIAAAAMALTDGTPALMVGPARAGGASGMRWAVVGVTALAAAQLFTHVFLLRFVSYGVDPLTVAPAVAPASMTQTSIRYGPAGEFRLIGFELPDRLSPGEYADAVLYWRLEAQQPPPTSYKVFIHVASTLDDTERIASVDEIPLNWALPTTCWVPGVLLRDVHPFDVDANARPGNWLALLGLYNEVTGERIKVFEAQRAVAGAVELPVTIVVK